MPPNDPPIGRMFEPKRSWHPMPKALQRGQKGHMRTPSTVANRRYVSIRNPSMTAKGSREVAARRRSYSGSSMSRVSWDKPVFTLCCSHCWSNMSMWSWDKPVFTPHCSSNGKHCLAWRRVASSRYFKNGPLLRNRAPGCRRWPRPDRPHAGTRTSSRRCRTESSEDRDCCRRSPLRSRTTWRPPR